MFNTVFLKDENDFSKAYKSKTIVNQKVNKQYLTNSIVNSALNWNFDYFSFSSGRVELNRTNFIYFLEYMPEKSDIILPKNPNLMDWVLLCHNTFDMAFNLNFDKITKMKIYGNSNRIMGFDEPLICDMQFASLRLTFGGDIDGWIIV